MSLKKKKNVIILTLCVVVCFILYQLYFFTAISSANSNSVKLVPVFDHSAVQSSVHIRSEADKHININGALRGVMVSNMPRYRPNDNNEFKCLLSEQKIPFEQVNDDYCDCEDSTDEPSTSACVNGKFYCDLQYKNKPVTLNTIPSHKVNDGICDCCDGSDEWLHEPGKELVSQFMDKKFRQYVSKCPNVC